MTDWVGGLPPAAHERIARQRASSTAGSLLSAPAAAALRSAGLAPVGEVFGCLVMQLSWYAGGCGAYGMGAGLSGFGGSAFGGNGFGGGWYETPIVSSGGRGRNFNGFGPYVKAYENAWQGALSRMLVEAAMLGAEGVVGVKVERTRIDGQAFEYSAMGTAVRSVDTSLVGRPREGKVWAAGLSAEDCAAAILSGLVPVGIALGISVATKHEDQRLRNQRNTWANTEVDALTALLQISRTEARSDLGERAQQLLGRGNGGDLVITDSHTSEFETPCGQEKDVHAEAHFVGTVLAPGPMADFRTQKRPGSSLIVNVLPLSDPSDRK